MICVGITKIKRKEKYLCHLCNENHDDSSSSSTTTTTTTSGSFLLSKNTTRKSLVEFGVSSSVKDEDTASKATRTEIELFASELNNSAKFNESSQKLDVCKIEMVID